MTRYKYMIIMVLLIFFTTLSADDGEIKKTYNNDGSIKFAEKYNKGTLISRATYLNEKISCIDKYYKDKRLKQHACYNKDGEVSGAVTEYWSNGNIKKKMQVKHGELNGSSIEYSEEGHIEKETIYKNNKTNGFIKKFYKNGKTKSEVPYLNDIVDGIIKIYNREGKLLQTIEFKEGEINDSYKSNVVISDLARKLNIFYLTRNGDIPRNTKKISELSKIIEKININGKFSENSINTAIRLYCESFILTDDRYKYDMYQLMGKKVIHFKGSAPSKFNDKSLLMSCKPYLSGK